MSVFTRLLDVVRFPLRAQMASDPTMRLPGLRVPAPQSRAMLVDGQMRTVAQLRSSYDGTQFWQRAFGDNSVTSFDDTTLANAYSAGLTAFVCINARAGLASEVPIRAEDDEESVITDSPAAGFVDAAPRMIWRSVASKLIWGVTYFLKHYNPHGYPTALEWLSPLDVRLDVDYARDIVRGYFIRRGSQEIYYKPCDVIADYTFNPFTDIDGISALEVAMTRSNIETNIGRFGEAFFRNSARPDGMLTFDGPMTDEEAKQARAYWQSTFKGAWNAFRTAIMGNEAGGKWVWQAVNANPVDLAMPELSNLADMKICAVMQVSPVLIGLGSASDPLSAQSTYEAIRRRALQDIAIPDVRQLCGALNDQWLHKDFPKSSVRWSLVPDVSAIISDALGTTERISTAGSAVAGHVWSVNEGREYTGKEPEKVITVQRNPDWATQVFQAGGMKRSQYQVAVGLPPDMNSDGYIWQLDPMRQPQQQPAPSFTFSLPHPQSAPQLPAPEPVRALIAEPVQPISIEVVQPRRDIEKLAQLHELDLWRKRVKKSGAAARFATETIPDAIARWVRSRLAEEWSSASVFDAAKVAIRANAEPEIGAAPEEYTAYWQDFDGLQADVREAWIEGYMQRAWEALQGIDPTALSDDEIIRVLESLHEDLTAQWIGSLEQPGALLAIALAGEVAGNKSLQSGYAAKPQRANEIGLAVDWSVLSQEALNFVQRYSFELIKGLDLTTVNAVRDIISAGINTGQSRDEITNALQSVFIDKNRARLIAQSEASRAYNLGAFERWGNAGVYEAYWVTVNDGSVCEICRRLNGKVADIRVGWKDPVTGKVYRDSAHPGDRCFRKPKVA